jgi:hypothetical protein
MTGDGVSLVSFRDASGTASAGDRNGDPGDGVSLVAFVRFAARRAPGGLALALAGLALAGLAAQPRRSHADTPRVTPAAIEIDRDSSPAGRVALGFDAGEPVGAWGASLAVSWLERPIRLAAGALGDGAPASQPVRRRETVTLGGAVALGAAVVLDAAVRASHQVGDRLRAVGDPEPLAATVFHDVRLAARIRVAGDGDRAALLRTELTLPTGDADQLSGEPRWTAAWSLIGRATLSGGVVGAATAGIRLRGAEVAVGDRVVGNEMFAAAGVVVPVASPGVVVTGALLGALGDRVAMRRGPNPFELQLGAAVQPLDNLRVGVQLGLGLGDQLGAPGLRALVVVAWAPPAAAAAPAPAVLDDEPDDDLEAP